MIAAALLGYIPAAMAIGSLGTYMHWSLWTTLGLSLFIYSGALQSALLGLMILNPPFVVVLGMAFALNLRHMLYGPHLEAERPGWPRWYRAVLSFFLTDELYAAGLNPSLSRRDFAWLSVVLYLGWLGGTLAGALGTQLVPRPWLGPFALALPALFIALLAPRIKASGDVWAVASALILAALGRLEKWPAGFAVVPIVVGATLGWYATRRREAP